MLAQYVTTSIALVIVKSAHNDRSAERQTMIPSSWSAFFRRRYTSVTPIPMARSA
jgi:hypothetical protein